MLAISFLCQRNPVMVTVKMWAHLTLWIIIINLNNIIITTRIPKEWERYCFNRRLFFHRGGGLLQLHPIILPSTGSMSFLREAGVPQCLGPCPFLGGYSHPVPKEMPPSSPQQEGTPARSGWGTPPLGTGWGYRSPPPGRIGWGTSCPQSRMGVPTPGQD